MAQPQPGPATLCDTGRIAALHRPAESRDLIIAFAPRQTGKDLWGDRFLGRFGASLLGLTDYTASWYPAEDMRHLHAELRPLLDAHDRVILYGFSMGAYAALKYSALFGSTMTLAFAPQFSIEPEVAGEFDRRRATTFFQPHLHREMEIRPEDLHGLSLVFFDPALTDDRQHARRIGACGVSGLIATPFTGHEPVPFARNIGLTEHILRRMLEGRAVGPDMVRQWRRAHRLGCPHYLLALSDRLLQRRDPEAALRLLRGAMAEGRNDPPLRLGLVHGLLELGQRQAALDVLAGLDGAERLTAEDRLSLWKARRRLGLEAAPLAEFPVLPAFDAAWAEAADFVAARVGAGDRVLAPMPFWSRLQTCAGLSERPERSDARYAWAIVHKGEMRPVDAAFLRALPRWARPVFANAVFVVWREKPAEGLPDLTGTAHVRPYMARLRKLPGQPWPQRLLGPILGSWRRLRVRVAKRGGPGRPDAAGE